MPPQVSHLELHANDFVWHLDPLLLGQRYLLGLVMLQPGHVLCIHLHLLPQVHNILIGGAQMYKKIAILRPSRYGAGTHCCRDSASDSVAVRLMLSHWRS